MFDFSNETEKKSYLNKAGIHVNGTFKSLEYILETNYECYDITIELDGAEFRNRTFGTTLEKVFTRNVYEKGKPRPETKEEAFEREYKEKFFKILHLVSCFVSLDEAKETIGKFDGLKDLVEKANSIIDGKTTNVNFLTCWRNSDTKQESRLIIPENSRWIEATQFDEQGNPKPATLSFNKYQKDNMLVEKYPYGGANESSETDEAVISGSDESDDLPF